MEMFQVETEKQTIVNLQPKVWGNRVEVAMRGGTVGDLTE
jgi:hypothetical protein